MQWNKVREAHLYFILNWHSAQVIWHQFRPYPCVLFTSPSWHQGHVGGMLLPPVAVGWLTGSPYLQGTTTCPTVAWQALCQAEQCWLLSSPSSMHQLIAHQGSGQASYGGHISMPQDRKMLLQMGKKPRNCSTSPATCYTTRLDLPLDFKLKENLFHTTKQ